jgi:hypothetical protein
MPVHGVDWHHLHDHLPVSGPLPDPGQRTVVDGVRRWLPY